MVYNFVLLAGFLPPLRIETGQTPLLWSYVVYVNVGVTYIKNIKQSGGIILWEIRMNKACVIQELVSRQLEELTRVLARVQCVVCSV